MGVLVCVCTHMHGSACCVEVRRQPHASTQVPSTFCLPYDLFLPWSFAESARLPGQQASRDLPVSASQCITAGIQAHAIAPSFFVGFTDQSQAFMLTEEAGFIYSNQLLESAFVF